MCQDNMRLSQDYSDLKEKYILLSRKLAERERQNKSLSNDLQRSLEANILLRSKIEEMEENGFIYIDEHRAKFVKAKVFDKLQKRMAALHTYTRKLELQLSTSQIAQS